MDTAFTITGGIRQIIGLEANVTLPADEKSIGGRVIDRGRWWYVLLRFGRVRLRRELGFGSVFGRLVFIGRHVDFGRCGETASTQQSLGVMSQYVAVCLDLAVSLLTSWSIECKESG